MTERSPLVDVAIRALGQLLRGLGKSSGGSGSGSGSGTGGTDRRPAPRGEAAPALRGGLRAPGTAPTVPPASGQRPGTSPRGAAGEEPSPGQFGAGATDDVSAAELASVLLSYEPDTDREPDPGEVVWTWVPYEEHDGRGKDRPVLIVGRLPGGRVVGCFLTSKSHDRDGDYVLIGAGPWDSQGRESWVATDRVLSISAEGMRREGHALDAQRFAEVALRLQRRYGWRVAERG